MSEASAESAPPTPEIATAADQSPAVGGGSVDAVCQPMSAADALNSFAATGSVLVGQLSLTGRTTADPHSSATLSEVTISADTYLGGKDRGPSFIGWVYGGLGADGQVTHLSPEVTSSWSPDGAALLVVNDWTPGPYVDAVPVADDMVMFTNFGCWDVSDLPTTGATAQRQYFADGKLVTDSVAAQAYPVAEVATLITG